MRRVVGILLAPPEVVDQVLLLYDRGRRLFEVLLSHIELEIARMIDIPEATHLRYRVRR